MSEWNRNPGRTRYDGDERRDWSNPDYREGRVEREPDNLYRQAGRQRGAYGGGSSGYTGGYGGSGYLQPGGSYGGETYERPAYGARSYGGHDVQPGAYRGQRSEGRSYARGDDARFDYRRVAEGGAYDRGDDRYGDDRRAYGRTGGYDRGYGEGRSFGDPNDYVREVADGDTRPSLFGRDRTGDHRGRGPKNYTRSDERIRDDVNDRLSDDSWLDASEIDVAVDKAEVTLTGTVDSRDDKRRAEDLAEHVSGVKHVQNNLRVQARQTPSSYSLQGTSPAGGPSENGLAGQNSVSGVSAASRRTN